MEPTNLITTPENEAESVEDLTTAGVPSYKSNLPKSTAPAFAVTATKRLKIKMYKKKSKSFKKPAYGLVIRDGKFVLINFYSLKNNKKRGNKKNQNKKRSKNTFKNYSDNDAKHKMVKAKTFDATVKNQQKNKTEELDRMIADTTAPSRRKRAILETDYVIQGTTSPIPQINETNSIVLDHSTPSILKKQVKDSVISDATQPNHDKRESTKMDPILDTTHSSFRNRKSVEIDPTISDTTYPIRHKRELIKGDPIIRNNPNSPNEEQEHPNSFRHLTNEKKSVMQRLLEKIGRLVKLKQVPYQRKV